MPVSNAVVGNFSTAGWNPGAHMRFGRVNF